MKVHKIVDFRNGNLIISENLNLSLEHYMNMIQTLAYETLHPKLDRSGTTTGSSEATYVLINYYTI